MIRKILMGAAASAIALGGIAAVGGTGAGAAPAKIEVVTGGTVECTMSSKAKISPALKDAWDPAENTADPEPLVNAIPYTSFDTGLPTTVSAKGKTIACTGSLTDGTNVATVTGIKITLTQLTNAVDNLPPNPVEGCRALLGGTDPGDQSATYKTLLKFKTSGAKLADATIDGATITPIDEVLIIPALNPVAPHDIPMPGFDVAGGTMGGSLVNSESSSKAFIDNATILQLSGAIANSTVNKGKSPTKCSASLKVKSKAGVPQSATLKAPKGMKKIGVSACLLCTLDETPELPQSTITVTG